MVVNTVIRNNRRNNILNGSNNSKENLSNKNIKYGATAHNRLEYIRLVRQHEKDVIDYKHGKGKKIQSKQPRGCF